MLLGIEVLFRDRSANNTVNNKVKMEEEASIAAASI